MQGSGPPRLTIGGMATPLGELVMVFDAQDILWASDFGDRLDRLHRLLSRRPGSPVAVPGTLPPAAAAVARYFAGDLAAIDGIVVRLDGSPFRSRVWEALREIPPGATSGYTEQAARLGNPKAARAVGSANGSNPCSLVVPCHRLVGADGALTGYAGGLWRKRWLLDHEQRHAARPGGPG